MDHLAPVWDTGSLLIVGGFVAVCCVVILLSSIYVVKRGD